MNHIWKLSSFDSFCLGMNIKSAWVYNETPDLDRMVSSLEKLAETYPILKGRYDEKEKSVIWNDKTQSKLSFGSLDLRDYSVSQLSGNAKSAWSLVKPFSITKFKKGFVPPFSATLGYLKDGCIATGACWILLSFFGALPFVVTKEIPKVCFLIFQLPVSDLLKMWIEFPDFIKHQNSEMNKQRNQ